MINLNLNLKCQAIEIRLTKQNKEKKFFSTYNFITDYRCL